MKKYYKAKAMRLVVSLSLIVCLLAGCSSSKTETQPEAVTEEATEDVKEESAVEPETKEEEAVVEESDENEAASEESTAE